LFGLRGPDLARGPLIEDPWCRTTVTIIAWLLLVHEVYETDAFMTNLHPAAVQNVWFLL